MHKHDIVKKINANLEKIIEDFIESLLIIKRDDNDMKSLFFAKRRIIDIILTISEIYDGLVLLRNIYKTREGKKTKQEEKELFLEFLNRTI